MMEIVPASHEKRENHNNQREDTKEVRSPSVKENKSSCKVKEIFKESHTNHVEGHHLLIHGKLGVLHQRALRPARVVDQHVNAPALLQHALHRGRMGGVVLNVQRQHNHRGGVLSCTAGKKKLQKASGDGRKSSGNTRVMKVEAGTSKSMEKREAKSEGVGGDCVGKEVSRCIHNESGNMRMQKK